jgi:hypothetical protein
VGADVASGAETSITGCAPDYPDSRARRGLRASRADIALGAGGW